MKKAPVTRLTSLGSWSGPIKHTREKRSRDQFWRYIHAQTDARARLRRAQNRLPRTRERAHESSAMAHLHADPTTTIPGNTRHFHLAAAHSTLPPQGASPAVAVACLPCLSCPLARPLLPPAFSCSELSLKALLS
eukprot:5240482-Prymnesium_polylepis.2